MSRRARPEDRERVCRWAAARDFPDEPVTGISGVQRARWLAERYRSGWDELLKRPQLAIWIDEQAEDYLVVLHGDKDTLTGDVQALLWDFGPRPELFLAEVESQALARGERYLVARARAGQEPPLAALGFRAEQQRIIAPIVGAENRSRFMIRRALSQDLFFIANLHSQACQLYPPAHRHLDVDELIFHSTTTYLSMDLGSDSETRGYLICQDSKPFGYVLYRLRMALEISGELAAYIYDLNLKPEGWGRSAARILLRQSGAELLESGHRFMIGDVSANNARVALLGGKAAGFQTEWVRWGLDLASR